MKKYIIQYEDYDDILSILGHDIPHSNLDNVTTVIVDLYDDEYEALTATGMNILEDAVGTEEDWLFTPGALSNSQNPPTTVLTYYNLTNAHAAGFDGSGVKIGIIDTGQHDNHHAAAPAVIRHDFTLGQSGTSIEVTPHGGRACMIIGQTNQFTGTSTPGASALFGFAYGAEIHSMRVEEDSGSFYASSIIAALNYAVANGFHIVNMSFQITNGAFDNALQACLDAGIIVVCASGNSTLANMAYPARYPGVISVNGWNNSVSPKVFGSYLNTPNPVTVTNYHQGCATFAGGTSQAAFMLTGLLGLYKQKYPSLDTPKAINLLRKKALQMDGFTYDIETITQGILIDDQTGAGFVAPLN